MWRTAGEKDVVHPPARPNRIGGEIGDNRGNPLFEFHRRDQKASGQSPEAIPPRHTAPSADTTQALGDFTTTWNIIPISAIAVCIGILAAFIALGLLRLIGLFTNLFFYRRWSAALYSPAGNRLGWLEPLVPVIGGLMMGFMARYGSERIRGHGIPEAIEAILMKGGRVEPKVAFWKPISSARYPSGRAVHSALRGQSS